ncbi:pyridoxamine 5'-phosphate oxidase family protein [Halobacteriaceae archaeon GCM10025711]
MTTVPPEAEALITDRKLMAHLATSVDDRPRVAPVWYDYEDGTISVLTGGRKRDDVQQNPRVAVSIQEDRDGDALWFVSLKGTATVVDDVSAINEAARTIYTRYVGPDVEEWDAFYRDHLGENPPNSLVEIAVGSVAYDVYEE